MERERRKDESIRIEKKGRVGRRMTRQKNRKEKE